MDGCWGFLGSSNPRVQLAALLEVLYGGYGDT